MRRLPPLSAVRVFEAAAELGMTQAAVSYQIRVLEDRLGLPLFHREKRRVMLTEAGRRASSPVSRAFDAIDSAFAELRAEDEGMLTISSPPTFANTWLAWRLGGFQMRNPEMAVRLVVNDAAVDFATEDLDVAIRKMKGPWDGLNADLLVTVDFTPMCSPGFLESNGRRLDPADVLRLPMISPNSSWWPHWLRDAGVTTPKGPIRRGVLMASQANDGNAAMAGQGIAILSPFFWRNDLAEGRLVRPFEQVSTAGEAYWLIAADHRRNVLKIRRFREWLLGELAQDRLKLSARAR